MENFFKKKKRKENFDNIAHTYVKKSPKKRCCDPVRNLSDSNLGWSDHSSLPVRNLSDSNLGWSDHSSLPLGRSDHSSLPVMINKEDDDDYFENLSSDNSSTIINEDDDSYLKNLSFDNFSMTINGNDDSYSKNLSFDNSSMIINENDDSYLNFLPSYDQIMTNYNNLEILRNIL